MIRVLFIDHNDADRQSWAGSLGMCSADYNILQAADARSGLELVESEQVDCVVLELDLPDRNGLSVLLRLVDYAHRPRIAVVVLTCLALEALSEIAFRNGAQSCLIKDKISIRSQARISISPSEEALPLSVQIRNRHQDRPLHN